MVMLLFKLQRNINTFFIQLLDNGTEPSYFWTTLILECQLRAKNFSLKTVICKQDDLSVEN